MDSRGLTAITMISRHASLLLLTLAAVTAAAGPPAPFDLAGPVFDVKISRGGSTLPASQVPNLAAGDRIWLKADLPTSQSAHYLMVVAFLRGATNPPPDGDCATACFNHPQKMVSLTTSWVQYSVPFADAVGGANRVTGVVQQLGWLTPDANWDFWIDEIQFYKGTPPTTAVGGNSAN